MRRIKELWLEFWALPVLVPALWFVTDSDHTPLTKMSIAATLFFVLMITEFAYNLRITKPELVYSERPYVRRTYAYAFARSEAIHVAQLALFGAKTLPGTWPLPLVIMTLALLLGIICGWRHAVRKNFRVKTLVPLVIVMPTLECFVILAAFK